MMNICLLFVCINLAVIGCCFRALYQGVTIIIRFVTPVVLNKLIRVELIF